jgi:hypothetical protein
MYCTVSQSNLLCTLSSSKESDLGVILPNKGLHKIDDLIHVLVEEAFHVLT